MCHWRGPDVSNPGNSLWTTFEMHFQYVQLQVLQALTSVLTAAVFLASAVPKLRHPRGFAVTVMAYEILRPGLALLWARIQPPVELLVALMLLTGTFVRPVSVVAILLLCSFIIAVIINLTRGRNIDCGCFRANHQRKVGSSVVVQDMILLAVALIAGATPGGWDTLASWSPFLQAGLTPAEAAITCFTLAAVIVALLATAMRKDRAVRSRRNRNLIRL